MGNLKKVTFTGVDEYTDIDRLVRIQEKYPYAEFGVLFSHKYLENGNRYPDPSIIGKLRDKGLNLSAHLCGRLVRDCYNGDWSWMSGTLSGNGAPENMFARCQLNVSPYGYKKRAVLEGNPFGRSAQFIIQQKSASDTDAYLASSVHSNVYLLCDPSGGREIDSGLVLYRPRETTKMVGYAGGINEGNVFGKLDEIAENTFADFWIDMESGVRDSSDRFDLDAVERVLEKVDGWLFRRYEMSGRLDTDTRSIELKFTVKCSSPVCMAEGGSLKERVRHYIKQCDDAMDESMRHWGDHIHSIDIEAASVSGDDAEDIVFPVDEL